MNKFTYVDLGLPSGRLWADRNLFAESERNAGRFYAFGEIEGAIPDDEHNFDEDETRFSPTWYKSLDLTYEKILDENNCLKPEYDAVFLSTEGVAHIPTRLDMVELWEETTPKLLIKYKDDGTEVELNLDSEKLNAANKDHAYNHWLCEQNPRKDNIILGVRFYSKVNSSSIFIPAVGGGLYGRYYSIGKGGYLWSSSVIFTEDEGTKFFGPQAYCFAFEERVVYGVARTYRFEGRPLRGVI